MLTSCITTNTVKLVTYQRDPDFLRSIEMMRSLWSANGQLHGKLWNHASLLIRPDGIVSNKAASIFSLLRERGLVPVAVRRIHMTSAQASALWFYQSNVATKERLSILDLLMTAGPSLYVVLYDASERQSAPACVHLTYLKGPSIAAKRRRLHLRSLAGPPLANLLTYLHGSDEPADFMREMALLFDMRAQADILAELDDPRDRTGEALKTIAELETGAPRGMLSPYPAAGPLGEPELRVPPHDDASRLASRWTHITRRALVCRSFTSGETYDTGTALVPDHKGLALPLDAHLIFEAFGPRY